MNLYKKMWVYITHPWKIVLSFSARKHLGIRIPMNDVLYLKLLYWDRFSKKLTLKNPKTFNEKLQWLKLYDRNPEYTKLVDKYEVKKVIADKIGDKYIIPTLGVWERFDDIDFNNLPNQFVLKCTHDSGGIVMVKDKTTFNRMSAKKKIESCLRRNFYYQGREWPYKNVKPRIIAEPYLTDESNSELKDYKVFAFNGEPKFIEVDFDRFTDHKRNIYSVDWELIDAEIEYKSSKAHVIPKPEKLQEMLILSKKLSEGMPHVRTDFYCTKDRVLFGEMTFYHESGLGKITPPSFEKEISAYINLPLERGNKN